MPFWWHSKVGLEWLAGKSLKPDLSVAILPISSFTSQLMNCFALKTLCSKTKQLISLLVKLLIDNMFVERSGLSLCQASRGEEACMLACLPCLVVCVYIHSPSS